MLEQTSMVKEIIQKSDLTNVELADKYNINIKTVEKWRCRVYQEDKRTKSMITLYKK